MSRLFRKSETKVAEEAAAQVEIDRLRALGIEDLAGALLPALGPDGVNHGQSVRIQELCNYLVRDFPGARQLKPLQLMTRVREVLETLEHAGLVSSISQQRLPVWRITRLGITTLADGTIRQHVRRVG
jgi:hypothetical protein